MKNGLETDHLGNKYWYKDSLFHREDGPAVEWAGGEKWWCIDGGYHRLDGPAIEKPDGTKSWYINDKYIQCKDNEEFIRFVKLKEFW